MVNTMPALSERVMQGLFMALANMQLPGRYWPNPPLRATAVLRARLMARRPASGSVAACWGEDVEGAVGVLPLSVCFDRQLTVGVLMSISLMATCSPVLRSKHA